MKLQRRVDREILFITLNLLLLIILLPLTTSMDQKAPRAMFTKTQQELLSNRFWKVITPPSSHMVRQARERPTQWRDSSTTKTIRREALSPEQWKKSSNILSTELISILRLWLELLTSRSTMKRFLIF